MLTNKICARHILTSIYTNLLLSIPNCRPWTSLGNTVFMQIVFSYNYERLIRSISTPFCLPNMYTFTRTYILTSILTPLFFYAPFTHPLYSYSLFSFLSTYTLYSYLYLYASILTPSLTTPSLPTPYYSPLYMYT